MCRRTNPRCQFTMSHPRRRIPDTQRCHRTLLRGLQLERHNTRLSCETCDVDYLPRTSWGSRFVLLFLAPVSPSVHFKYVKIAIDFLGGRYVNSLFLSERFCEQHHKFTTEPFAQLYEAVVPGVDIHVLCTSIWSSQLCM